MRACLRAPALCSFLILPFRSPLLRLADNLSCAPPLSLCECTILWDISPHISLPFRSLRGIPANSLRERERETHSVTDRMFERPTARAPDRRERSRRYFFFLSQTAFANTSSYHTLNCSHRFLYSVNTLSTMQSIRSTLSQRLAVLHSTVLWSGCVQDHSIVSILIHE